MKKLTLAMLAACCLVFPAAAQAPDTQDNGDFKSYLVATAHFDTQWNWDVQESIGDYLHRTMVQNFWLFEHYPDYVFNFESAQKYSWMKEYYPQDFAKVVEYVKAGRWNVCGSAWEATDPNMPSAESFFRNILYGQQFYKNEFGTKANDIYLPDCFGFGYTLPTIASHCGLIGFSTQKLQWRKNVYFGEKPDKPIENMWRIKNEQKIPYPICLWKGIDGSQIMAALDCGGYGTSYFYTDVTTNRRIIERAGKDPNHIAYTYYGVGDRGGSPTLPSVHSVMEALGTDGPVKVISARSGQIYEDFLPFESHPELPVYDGELLMDVHGVGCYTSQAAMKMFNRRNEHLGAAAEAAWMTAELLGAADYPADALRENYQRFLWHQFHDDITGTSIPSAYTFSWNDEIIAQTRFADAITAAVGDVSMALDTRTGGIPLVIYNPVATARKDVVEASVPMPVKPAGIKVTAPSGREVPAQLLSWENGNATILFSAEVDALSYSVFNVSAGRKQTSKKLTVTERKLENSTYRVTLNDNGDLCSVFDKRYGRELVKDGEAFGLLALTDNVSHDYPAWEIYKRTLDGPSEAVGENVRISIEENGPCRITLRVEKDFGDSHFIQHVSLTDGAADDIVCVLNEVDWHGRRVLLKADFPMSIASEKAAYDLGLGHVFRGNDSDCSFEVLGHQWADLSDDDADYGVSILNNCKYGWDKPDDSTLRLTLFHTPFSDGSFYAYQEALDHGKHRFSYAIMGHDGDLCQATTDVKAECFNQPLMAFVAPKHKGTLGKSCSLARLSSPQIKLFTLKKAEDGDGYIVRVGESFGKDYSNASVSFNFPVLSAEELNGIEEYKGPATVSGNSIVFSGTAYQPRTFRVRLAGSDSLRKQKTIPVELKYNALALTSDEFNRAGNFDGAGNSLAEELMPEVILSDGIDFHLNNSQATFNVIRCKADTLSLPAGHGCTKLYMLATSISGDRKATFKVDGKEYDCNVPYYTGFFGQWGWDGNSEAYVKDGHFGYVMSHRHSAGKGNEPYSLAYLYKFCLDIPADASTLILPADAGIAVFAVKLAEDDGSDIRPAAELRALPEGCRENTWETEPVKYFNGRSDW